MTPVGRQAIAIAAVTLLTNLLASAEQLLYWVDPVRQEIRRAPLDATQPDQIEILVAGLNSPQGLDIDPVAGYLYWAEIGGQRIMRAGLDGSDPTVLLADAAFVKGLTLDRASDALYWCDPVLNWIQRLDLSTLQASTVVQGLAQPQDLRVADGTVYWVQSNQGVFRRPLDEGPIQSLTPGFNGQATVLAADADRCRLFWIAAGRINALADDGTFGMTSSIIVGRALGIDTVPGTNELVWSEGGALYQADPSGANVRQILTIVETAERIAVGPRLAAPSVRDVTPSSVVEAGAGLELSVSVEGTGPFSYQWAFEDGIGGDERTLTNQTESTLRIERARLEQAGRYRCTITGPGGVTTTPPIVVAVRFDPAARFPAELTDLLQLLVEMDDCDGC